MTSTTASRKASTFQRVLSILSWPIRLLLRPFVYHVSKDGNRVRFTSFHKAVFLWPVWAVGTLVPSLISWGWFSEATAGYIAFSLIVYMFLLLAFDLDAWKCLWVAVAVGFVLLLGEKLEVFGIRDVTSYFFVTSPKWEPGLMTGLARLCGAIQLFFVLPHALLAGRYELSTRELTRFVFFRSQAGYPRAGRKPVVAWPDLLEALATGFGGNIELRRGERVEVAVRHVPFLMLFKREVDRILDRIATANDIEEEVAAEEDVA